LTSFEYNPVQTTPFSKKEKLRARLWRLVWVLFYRPTPWFMYKFRVFLLNSFGANIDYSAHPENSSFVEFPWNLTMGKKSSIGEGSWIYCLDKIVIGENSCIGQGCQLITGSHNYKSKNFEMITAPISIGTGCWLTSSVTVLMGVNINDYSVVGINSLVTKSIDANRVALGQPTKIVGKRF
jgi:putative colanic acid biosynthesis acetyltransferase WcaF